MKPIYFLLFSLLTLFACTDQQTELEGASHAMRFGVEEVEDTKGAVITTQNIRSMSVFCAHTGSQQYKSSSTCNWMHNAEVTRVDEKSEWTVQGEGINKQWNDEGYHSFFAFAPHLPQEVFSASTDSGPPVLTYTVPADHTKQVDLLYSLTTPINCKQMYIGSRPVVFGFRHALSKITFEVARAADVDPSTYFAIDKISLQNIHSTGTLSFEMDPELKQVIDAGWSDVSKPGNYTVVSDTIRGLKFLWTTDYQIHSISVDNTGLFVLPQEIDNNAVIEISFYETINGVYSPNRVLKLKLSDLLSEFQFGKAYRFSIVLKEDKVTITAQITNWKDQTVDVALPGTYLNVSNTNVTAAYGSVVKIFYATDAHVDSVKAACDKGISFDLYKISKYISIPSTTALGDYIFTLTAGKLSQKVRVTIAPPSIQIGNLYWTTGNLVADGNSRCKVGNPQDDGLYFQWGSLIGWTGGSNGDGTGFAVNNLSPAVKVKPADYRPTPNWLDCPQGSMSTSPSGGTGDPCQYYLGNGWRLPSKNEFDTNGQFFGQTTLNNRVGRWFGPKSLSSVDQNKCIWLPYAGSRSSGNGVIYLDNSVGYYWTSNNSAGMTNAYTCYMHNNGITYSEFPQKSGVPIRCVKPVPIK